jgi:ankyrin repeat protein
MSLSAEQKNSQMNQERTVLTNLIQAARNGNYIELQNVIHQYLRQHMDLSIVDVISQFRDGNKRTALHFACQSTTAAPLFVTSPTTATTTTEDIVARLIQELMETKQSKKIQKLIRMKDSEGLTPVMIAAQCQHHPLCEQRMYWLFQADIATLPASERGTSFHGKVCSTLGLARSKDGATALHYACGNPYASITTIRETIPTGRVAVRTFSNTGGTPFHWAVTANHLNKAGTTPTHFSITGGQNNLYSVNNDGKNSVYVGTIETLLQYGADINAFNETIPPPLTVAMATGNDVLAHYILSQHGKEKIDLLDLENEVIKQHNLRPSIEYILQPGNATTLHMAADINLPNSLSLLLDTIRLLHYSEYDIEALLDRCNDDGYTALDLAAKEKHTACVVLLLNAKNKNTACTTTEDAQLFIQNWKPTTNAPKVTNPSPMSRSASSDTGKSDSSNDPTEVRARTDASRILADRNVTETKVNDPDSILEQAKGHKEKGNAHFIKKQWEDAIGEYTKAIALQPHVATYYSNRSACYMSTRQYELALYDAIVAQCLDPEWSKAYYRVAVARLELQRYEDAAVAAWEGLQKQPENEELQSLLRKCVKKGRTDYHQK